jgi:nucleosome binding factor SPN SPT16 subunit
MVAVTKDGSEVMTKLDKALTNVSYTINDDDDDEEEEDEDEPEDVPDAPKGDEEYARKVQKEATGQRQSARLAKDANAAVEAQEGIVERERRQIDLMTRRNEERLRELARANARKGNKDGESEKAEELETYPRTKNYPDNVLPNQVKVDMANQAVILPINGNPVPFHISTIKNVVLPDPDAATYLRINFYTAGLAVGKDAPANTAKLVAKYAPYACFIRELTFRSLDSHNLTQVGQSLCLSRFGRYRHLLTLASSTFFSYSFRRIVRYPSFVSVLVRESFANKRKRILSSRRSLCEQRTSASLAFPI